jgi:signal transduction histidine kinase
MVREISRRLRENDEMAIDDLRMRASELAEAYQKLAEQEVARRDFLTNVSHQLRTPLTAASGYLQMLQKGAIPAEKTTEAMELVTRNVQQIASLVNDILFVQEMDLILEQFEPVNLVDLVRQVASRQAGKMVARKIALRVKPDLFLVPVMGDRQNLERAFTALLDNAIKFSPEGGRVEVRLHRKGEQIGVEISDQGIGIQPEILPHIFERFYHLDKIGDQLNEGLGLGLAITKQVIEQHKGHLDVISTPGKGSTFIIWLNIHAEKNGEPHQESGTTI